MSGTANPIRGEQRIRLDADYVMRPSHEALQAIEDQTGLSMFRLSMQATSGDMKGLNIAIIVTECIKADLRHTGKADQADRWDVNRVGKLLMDTEGGLFEVIKKLIPLLNDAITGKYTSKGEAKPAVAKKTKDTPAGA
ncbi:hypothetical protein SAMN05444678_102266 [Sphingomonas sp. YR710]|uniref:hypothetical protein n=1 Tax=Sphingomonas sp. YR710 TaxID=1882773 RepID=UPI00088F5BE5|nr:hypothetical protein [Sphingomonas sp. YR710]SDC31000.1 hypothetical protein SAMN05444678_102266 [Sphingomonas sp. YR710]